MQLNHILNYPVETEPSIQQVKTIKIQKLKKDVKQISSESDNVESEWSCDDVDYIRKQFIDNYSMFTTKNSIQGKLKVVNQKQNSDSIKVKLASISNIKSFRLDNDSQSEDEEESLPKDFMKVNFQFRHDAIINVQKILEQKK